MAGEVVDFKELFIQQAKEGFDWLKPTYSLPNICQELRCQFRTKDIVLYKIEEITYEEESPRQEALENVFASMLVPGINLVYLIYGEKNKVNFYFGVAKDLQENLDINIREIAEKILVPSLRGNFRGSKISKVSAEDSLTITDFIRNENNNSCNLKYATVEGVPGISKDKEKKGFQGVDRLVDVMLGDVFGLMVLAKPLCKSKEIGHLESSLEDIYYKISQSAKWQLQTGFNFGTNESINITNGISEQLSEGYTTSEQKSNGVSLTNGTSGGASVGHSKTNNASCSSKSSSTSTNKGISVNKGISDSKNTSIGESLQVSHSVNDSIAKSEGSSHQDSRTVSMDCASKNLQEWLKYFDEIIYPRLDCALGKGLFVTSTLIFAQEKPVLDKLGNVMKSIFSGEVGNRSPLKMIELAKNDIRLESLKSFQQPILSIRSNATENDCYAAVVNSKCMCFKNGKMDDFYAGTWMSTVELGQMAGIPQKEVVGLRLREEVEFGLNVSSSSAKGTLIDLGNLVQSGNEQKDIAVKLDSAEFDRHIFIAGVTGSGKTTTCHRLLCESNRPFLVIEPAKTEYRILLNKMPDLMVYTLGTDNVAPFRLNPLEFVSGEQISSRVDMLMASITAAFDMEAAIPQLIESALYKSYEDYGWNIKNNTNKFYPGEQAFADGVYAFPTLSDVLKCVDTVVADQGFDERLKKDYLGSIKARLQGLIVGAKGMMLNCKRSIDFEKLLDKRVVLELEEVRNGSEKSLIIGFVLTNLLVAIKRKFEKGGNKKINHFTLVEEAHRLLSKYEPGDNPNKKHAVETFSDMLAEIRKYGESMIIADQIPNKLTPDVLKNTNMKIVHRIFAQDDKDAIGSTMSLNEEQRDFLSNLDVGRAIVFSGSWPKAIHTQIKNDTDTSSSEFIPNEVLRENIMHYYFSQENYAHGIFPGIEELGRVPTSEEIHNYIELIQNQEFEKFFEGNKINVKWKEDSKGAKKETIIKPILVKCDKRVLARALVARYSKLEYFDFNFEKVLNFLSECQDNQ